MIGDYVGTGTALNEVGVDTDTATRIVPLFNARDLRGALMNGIDAFFGCEAGVRGAAVDDESCFADTFAGSFQKTPRTERRFEDKDGIASASFGFDKFAGCLAADLFVRGPKKNDALVDGKARFQQGVKCEEGLDDSRFHIEGAGTEGLSVLYVKRHFCDSSGRGGGV